MTDTVFICETCRNPDGPADGGPFAIELRRALDQAGLEKVEIKTVACMNLCTEPVSLALTGNGKETYLFAGVRPETDLKDAVGLVGLYAQAADGTMLDARAAGRLRTCLKGRVPTKGTPVTR